MIANSRPCGACRNLDARLNGRGAAYCWRWFRWQRPADVVVDCTTAERADGQPPPGQIRYEGEGHA